MGMLASIQTIDSVVRIAKPIIDTVCTSLVPEMKDFADRLFALSEKYPSLEAWAKTIDKAADFMRDLLFAVGITSDSADVLGMKAGRAEKTVSDFESVEAYIQYLHDEIDLDKSDLDNLSPIERAAYQTAGLAIEAGALGETVNTMISADFTLLLAKIKDISDIAVSASEIVSIIVSLKDKGISRMDDICEYVEAKGDSDRIKAGEAFREVLEERIGESGNEVIENLKMDARRS